MKQSERIPPFYGPLAAIALLAAFLRLYALGRSCLWVDEVLTAEYCKAGIAGIVKLSLHDTGPLPLSYLFPWLLAPGGKSELLLRLPDAIFGILTVPLAALTARRLSGSTLAGLAAAALLAVSQHHIDYSREARGYGLLAFLALLGFWLLIDALERGGRRRHVALAINCLAGLYSSYFFCFVLAGYLSFAAAWIAAGWRCGEYARVEAIRRAKPLALALIAPVAAFAPWIALSLGTFRSYAAAHPSAGESAKVGAWLIETLRAWLPASLCWQIVVATLIVVGDLVYLKTRKGLLILIAVLPVGLAAAAFSLSTSGHFLAPRYLIAALPICTVAAGMGLAALAQIPGKRRRAGIVLAAALFVANGWVQLKDYPQRATAQKEDWRAVATFLERSIRPGDRILPGGDATDVCLMHYFPPTLAMLVIPREAGEGLHLSAATQEAIDSGIRIWYVSPDPSLERSPDLLKWLNQVYKKVESIPGREASISIYLSPSATRSK